MSCPVIYRNVNVIFHVNVNVNVKVNVNVAVNLNVYVSVNVSVNVPAYARARTHTTPFTLKHTPRFQWTRVSHASFARSAALHSGILKKKVCL